MDYKKDDKVLMNPKSRYRGQEENSDYGVILKVYPERYNSYKYSVVWVYLIDGKKEEGRILLYNDEDLLPLTIKEKQLEFAF